MELMVKGLEDRRQKTEDGCLPTREGREDRNSTSIAVFLPSVAGGLSLTLQSFSDGAPKMRR